MCPFDYTAFAGSGKVGPVNQVNYTSWVAIVTPTDRPKSVRNRYVIELFGALFMLSFCPFDISVGVGTFVLGLSQIYSSFSCSEDWSYIKSRKYLWMFEVQSSENHDRFWRRVCLNK